MSESSTRKLCTTALIKCLCHARGNARAALHFSCHTMHTQRASRERYTSAIVHNARVIDLDIDCLPA
jgi:hypothetical protein